MARFAYKAFSRTGEAVDGMMEAQAEQNVLTVLRRRQLKVLSITEDRDPWWKTLTAGQARRRRVAPYDVMRFTTMFATLVNAGVPMMSCIQTLLEQTDHPGFRAILQEVLLSLEGGQDLSTALAQHPAVFDRLYVDLVRAGETGGVLHVVLERLAVYRERSEKFRRKIKGAMTYPALVICIAIAIVWVILTFVVPEFASTFAGAGKVLPLPTRILMSLSDGVRDYWFGFFVVIAGAIAAFRAGLKNARFQALVDRFSLQVPVYGELVLKSSIARFARTLALLLVSGIPLIKALEVVANVTGNRVVTKALVEVADAISGGDNFSDPLKRSGVFSPIVVQMVAVGESTGNISEMLTKVADFYEDEVQVVLDTLFSLIEPAMIVFLGVVLGFVIIALFLPILTLSEVVPL